MRRSPSQRVLALVGIILAFTLTTPAQDFRATLTGRVTDPTGAAVPGAEVTVRNRQTEQELTVTTNEEGNYTVPLLDPNDYRITVTAPNFKTTVNESLTLFTGDTRTFDVTLEVGGVGESVTVTAEASVLEPDTATRGQVIENARINELPLIGRNPINLTDLATGVVFNGNPTFRRPFDNGDNVQFSINGGVQRHNEFLLDGAPNNALTDVDADRTRSSNNVAFVPPAEATQEFKVQTNSYDAEYGRTGGGIINLTLKSGGNNFDGSIYEYLQRYQLSANDFTSNRLGRPRYAVDPVTGENLGGRLLDQFGGVISGPVYLPFFGEGGRGYYSGKDRTFFLFTFEEYNEATPSPGFSDVPTLLERQGDFRQSGVTIYDPLTTRANPNFNSALPVSGTNPQFIRDPVSCNGVLNVICPGRINPVGQAIVNGFDLPNFGAPTLRFNNFILSPNLETDDFYSTVARIDHAFNDETRLFGRYVRNRRDQFALGGNRRTGLGLDAQDPLFRINDAFVLDLVRTITPTSTVNLRVSYSRFNQAAFRQSSSPFEATALGFPQSFSSSRPVSIVPRIQFDQYREFGPRNPNYNITNTTSFQGNYTLVAGNHTIKTGGEFRDIRTNQGGGSFTFGGGLFTFTRNFTQLDPSQGANNTEGSAIASLLLGYPASGQVDNVTRLSFRQAYIAPYIQDDWKVTRRLTLNLGFRYDFEASPIERFNRQNRGFAFDQSSPVEAAARAAYTAAFNANPANFAGLPTPDQFRVRGGLLFAGVGGQPEAAFDQDRNNFQPRVGVAYAFNDKTVFRGGYGLFYFPQAEFGGSTGFAVTTGFVPTTGGGAQQYIPANTLGNPFPTGLIQPVGSSLGLATQLGQRVIFNLPERVIPKIHQYSAGIQRELPGRIKLDVSYVGSASRDVLTNDAQTTGPRNINVLSAEALAQVRANPTFFNAAVANPFAGLLPGTPFNGANITRSRLLLPFPQFGDVLQGAENVGTLDYNSLQASAEKRLSRGLVTVVSYTFSKNLGALSFLNNQDAAPARAVVDFDRTHVLAVSGVYQIPFGRGRRFGGGIPKAVDLLFGGFEYTFSGRLQTGRPINLPGGFDLIADPNINGNNYDRFFNNCVRRSNGTTTRPRLATSGVAPSGFEPCTDPAFAATPANTLRTAPLRLSNLREPTSPIFDMALNKTFFFTEEYRLQFRLESFNTFNTPLTPGPNTDPNGTQFGFVNLGSNRAPRNIQLGFKFLF